MNPSLFNKILGALIGYAIGDSVGAITKDLTREEIREKYTPGDLSPGGITFNTEMMLSVADAYLIAASRPVNYEELCCRNFEAWYVSNKTELRDTNRVTIAGAFGKPKDMWLQISHQVNKDIQPDNQALLRCLFPALVNNDNAAISQGLLTHNNNESSRCIFLYTELLQRYLSTTLTLSHRSAGHMEPHARALNTFNNAAYWAAEKSFKQAILSAAQDGGSSDVITALTGALAGARFGFNRIPEDWVSALEESIYTKLRTVAEKASELLIQEELQ